MEILSKIPLWWDMYIIENNAYIPLLWGLVILIIGLFFEGAKKNYLKKKDLEDALNIANLKVAINEATPAQLARAFSSLKTINIYYEENNGVSKDQHKAMIGFLVTHLEIIGFTRSMTALDEFKMKEWDNPVLVIHPALNHYMFHNDQKEDRKASRSFTIQTNCMHTLERAIDNEISVMKGALNA